MICWMSVVFNGMENLLRLMTLLSYKIFGIVINLIVESTDGGQNAKKKIEFILTQVKSNFCGVLTSNGNERWNFFEKKYPKRIFTNPNNFYSSHMSTPFHKISSHLILHTIRHIPFILCFIQKSFLNFSIIKVWKINNIFENWIRFNWQFLGKFDWYFH